VFDLPTGAVIVVTLALAFAVTTILPRGTAVARRRAETTA